MTVQPDDVTVAIPCYNIERTIGPVLEAVNRLDPPPARIICVDGGSTDETQSIIHDHGSAELFIQRGSNTGISAAQNIALEQTDTDGLLQLDGDVVLRPEWLQIACEAMAEQDVSAVGGPMVEHVTTKADEWRVHHVSNLPYVTTDVDLERADEWHETYSEKEARSGWPEPKEDVLLLGGILLLETDAIRMVGGWDDRYKKSFDDTYLCTRLLEEGYGTFYTPDAKGLHIRTDTPRSILRTLWNYSYSGRHEPTGYRCLPKRFANHTYQAMIDVMTDLSERRLRLIPISLQRPFVHSKLDFEHVYTRGKI